MSVQSTAREAEFEPGSRDIIMGCVRTMAVSQKKVRTIGDVLARAVFLLAAAIHVYKCDVTTSLLCGNCGATQNVIFSNCLCFLWLNDAKISWNDAVKRLFI